MNKERYAVALILLALVSGSVLTAATSGCNSVDKNSTQSASASESTKVDSAE